MQSLRETRNGLFKIYEEQPRYSKAIMPKMEALNNLIAALIVDNLPHPWLKDPIHNNSKVIVMVKIN